MLHPRVLKVSQPDKILLEHLGASGDQPLQLRRMSSDGGLVAIYKEYQGKASRHDSRRRSVRSLRRHTLHLRPERMH